MRVFEVAQTAGLVSAPQVRVAEAIGRCAAECVAPTVAERARARRFDRDLWRNLAGRTCPALMVPGEWGGGGHDARTCMMALDAFVAEGRDMGLAVSLNVHNQLLRYLFVEYATAEQRERYLPPLVRGEKLVCLAVSEPETGAHPKHLTTRAEREGNTYFITGHKAYITNGPESDVLIAIAVTDDSGPLKGISAFLVDRNLPGVEISEPMDLGFLRTSPHAQVRFTRTPVPAENLLGPEHEAYGGMVRAFRDHEDAFSCALFSGLLAWQLRETIAGAPGAAAAENDAVAAALADAQSALEAARLAGITLAALRDAGEAAGEAEGALIDACGAAFRRGADAVGEAWSAFGMAEGSAIARARAEMGLGSIAGRVRAIRRAQRGRRLAQSGRSQS